MFLMAMTQIPYIHTAYLVFDRLDQEQLSAVLPRVLASWLDRPDADYADYRRAAELFRHLGQGELLAEVVRRAGDSSDKDILEVAEDFG
jgi:hypothetical protein